MESESTADILLVEDNESEVELLRRAVERQNLDCRLHIVTDGQEALDYLFSQGEYAGRDRSQNPRLVLLDLNLPRVDGKEVLSRVRDNKDTSLLPVVVFSSSDDPHEIQTCYELGANAYVQKPLVYAEFLASVESTIRFWGHVNLKAMQGI